jgi:hypothetical protein
MTAIDDIAAERRRQIEKEGWTPEHDDAHDNDQMAQAAAAYALATFAPWEAKRRIWPWDLKWWKPRGHRENLVRAGALIVAEIERLDRAAKAKSEHASGAVASNASA